MNKLDKILDNIVDFIMSSPTYLLVILVGMVVVLLSVMSAGM